MHCRCIPLYAGNFIPLQNITVQSDDSTVLIWLPCSITKETTAFLMEPKESSTGKT